MFIEKSLVLEWEQLGTHKEHLSVLDFKKQERQEEIKALDSSIGKLQQKQVDIQAVEDISFQRVPLSSKVMVEREDFDALTLAAKKYVAQEKKERRLQKLLDNANKTIGELKKALHMLKKELDFYKSVKGQINMTAVQQENAALRKQNEQYRTILQQHGLLHTPEPKRSICDMVNNR